jgi:hypothetical protein
MMSESLKELLIKYHIIETQFWARANIRRQQIMCRNWPANQANIMKALAQNSRRPSVFALWCLFTARPNLHLRHAAKDEKFPHQHHYHTLWFGNGNTKKRRADRIIMNY